MSESTPVRGNIGHSLCTENDPFFVAEVDSFPNVKLISLEIVFDGGIYLL
ncbi:unnamed protein product [Musa acuminata subsp. burmannicoides]